MASVGGSVESVSIKGRSFAVAADADPNRNIGGSTNEIMPNGDGTARIKSTKAPWKYDGLNLANDENRADQDFLQDVVDSMEQVSITVTHADGSTYSGTGTIIGEIVASSQSATIAVSLSGMGKLVKQ